MRRYLLSLLLALGAGLPALSRAPELATAPADGSVMRHELTDGAVPRPSQAWRLSAPAHQHGPARERLLPLAPGSHLAAIALAPRIEHAAYARAGSIAETSRRHYPLFPTGPPGVHAQA